MCKRVTECRVSSPQSIYDLCTVPSGGVNCNIHLTCLYCQHLNAIETCPLSTCVVGMCGYNIII